MAFTTFEYYKQRKNKLYTKFCVIACILFGRRPVKHAHKHNKFFDPFANTSKSDQMLRSFGFVICSGKLNGKFCCRK